jgi:hypothetical protein
VPTVLPLLLSCPVLSCQAFAPFVAAGFLEFVYGGADVGKHCTHHPLVDSVHLTGSEATYNSIVFGSPKVKVGVHCRCTAGGCASLCGSCRGCVCWRRVQLHCSF